MALMLPLVLAMVLAPAARWPCLDHVHTVDLGSSAKSGLGARRGITMDQESRVVSRVLVVLVTSTGQGLVDRG